MELIVVGGQLGRRPAGHQREQVAGEVVEAVAGVQALEHQTGQRLEPVTRVLREEGRRQSGGGGIGTHGIGGCTRSRLAVRRILSCGGCVTQVVDQLSYQQPGRVACARVRDCVEQLAHPHGHPALLLSLQPSRPQLADAPHQHPHYRMAIQLIQVKLVLQRKPRSVGAAGHPTRPDGRRAATRVGRHGARPCSVGSAATGHVLRQGAEGESLRRQVARASRDARLRPAVGWRSPRRHRGANTCGAKVGRRPQLEVGIRVDGVAPKPTKVEEQLVDGLWLGLSAEHNLAEGVVRRGVHRAPAHPVRTRRPIGIREVGPQRTLPQPRGIDGLLGCFGRDFDHLLLELVGRCVASRAEQPAAGLQVSRGHAADDRAHPVEGGPPAHQLCAEGSRISRQPFRPSAVGPQPR
eukprot:scaffold769_cov105-Isochrysis_galbana.AAC.2